MIQTLPIHELDTHADLVLARQAQADPGVFTRLYQQHLPAVYRYLYACTGNQAEAEDLTSITFMAALESLERYRGQGRLAAWLMGIARNQVAMHFRSRRPELALDWALEQADPGPSTEQSAGLRLQIESVSLALESLSLERAEAVRLCAFAGLSAAEAGEQLGKSETAIRMLLLRGLRDLRQHPLLAAQEEE